MEHLQSFIKDCDRKIQIAKKRLEETQDDHDNVPEVGVEATVQVWFQAFANCSGTP